MSVPTFDAFRIHLLKLTGLHWLERVTEAELKEFFDWICRCHSYRRNGDDPEWLTEPGDAFRGFVKGLEIARKGSAYMMKLYRISQTVNEGYDTFSDAVVAAQSSTAARVMHPNNTDPSSYTDSTWAKPEDVKVEYLGVAKSGTKAGFICASFHAG